MLDKSQPARIIKANKALQIKIGGPAHLDEQTIEKCQKILDENTLDFVPMGQEYLENIKTALENFKSGQKTAPQIKEEITPVIMQIKANAPVMKYALVGELAALMLGFLETVKNVDEQAIEIIEANLQTLNALLSKKIRGNGGELGAQLKKEIEAAFGRYHAQEQST